MRSEVLQDVYCTMDIAVGLMRGGCGLLVADRWGWGHLEGRGDRWEGNFREAAGDVAQIWSV